LRETPDNYYAMISGTIISRRSTLQRYLLTCGILSSLLYVVMNIAASLLYEGYDVTSQTISELSAIGAPTRGFWVPLGHVYTMLVTAFGAGLMLSSGVHRSLYIAGILICVYGLLGIGWAFAPMHQRHVLAAGGGNLSDTMHIALSVITVILMIASLIIVMNAFGKRFRAYSVLTIVLMVGLGIWTGIDGGKLNKDLPTPGLGIVERILLFLFLLWIVVVAVKVLRSSRAPRW
jgi:hypothetical protein